MVLTFILMFDSLRGSDTRYIHRQGCALGPTCACLASARYTHEVTYITYAAWNSTLSPSMFESIYDLTVQGYRNNRYCGTRQRKCKVHSVILVQTTMSIIVHKQA